MDNRKVIIVGAGPAGLTAAYKLRQRGIATSVLEKEGDVGGISKTITYNGYRFDIGGHRFFTKVTSVEDMWMEILGEKDFLLRKRLSRIYYNKKFFQYPLRIHEVVRVLGIVESAILLGSYFKWRLNPVRPENSFEAWVTNRFGRRLYRMFFKTYTEKVWGMACHEISADWAAQRIKGLSMLSAIRNALLPNVGGYGNRKVLRTLTDSFRYPRFGPGMMWEETAKKVCAMGGRVSLNTKTQRIHWKGNKILGLDIEAKGCSEHVPGTHFISTMPIRNLIRQMEPAPPPEVCEAAERLHYRDFFTVALILREKDVFTDNWIYIHDPSVKVGRIQNFKNWSPEMVPDPEMTCLGLEYFCFEGDHLWDSSDEDLIELAKKEIVSLGLARKDSIEDGTVVRMPKAYPVYDDAYQNTLKVVRDFLDGFDNLYLTGRNGMHKYNNQDHSMLSAMLAVENICGASHDLWSVNADEEYHEEVRETGTEKDFGQERQGQGQGDAAERKQALQRDLVMLASTQPSVPKRADKSEKPRD